jgi:phosphatidylserine/phosphatidylglycerophosphate/cardiolipin synthase-like enzyme
MQKQVSNERYVPLAVVAAIVVLTLIVWQYRSVPEKGGVPASGEISTCFTPGENCTKFVVDAIALAREEILVQAYNYTSKPILEALREASEVRKLRVRVILDKSNEQERYCPQYSITKSIETLTDDKPAIAHNKVIIIDRKHVLTGSFNFTSSAQNRNAENIVFIRDTPGLADRYVSNWISREAASRPFANQCASAKR